MSFNLSFPNRKVHAGVILTKGITEMLDVAPFEFLTGLKKKTLQILNFPPEMVAEGVDIELHWVTEDGGPAEMSCGARILPTNSFVDCPALDIVLMGAHRPGYHTSPAELAFICHAYDQCSAFLTICGGIVLLLEAGLLEGKTVAAPRMVLGMMQKNAPHVKWVDKRWVKDGKIWSSSTLMNGTDLMRGFAVETWGGSGRNGMVEAMLDVGHWPARDVGFKDFRGKQLELETLE